MEQLIFKYLNEKLTVQEEITLREWLESNSENRQVFENMVSYWKLSETQINSSKERVFSNIIDAAQKSSKKTKESSSWKYVWRIAAILVLATGLGLVFNYVENRFAGEQQGDLVFIEKEAQYGQKLICELPDGSTVKLNSGSKISYPKHFKGSNREVSLSGEAFFDVFRNPERPFVIRTSQMNITVLGTSFNVNAYTEDAISSVAVKTGKVAVKSTVNDQEVTLLPNEKVQVAAQDAMMKKGSVQNDEKVFGWLEQTLMFEDDDLPTIITRLERWYDVKVEVVRKMNEKKTFTGKYKNPSLRAVMESLSYAYDFEYELNGKKVIIK